MTPIALCVVSALPLLFTLTLLGGAGGELVLLIAAHSLAGGMIATKEVPCASSMPGSTVCSTSPWW